MPITKELQPAKLVIPKFDVRRISLFLFLQIVFFVLYYLISRSLFESDLAHPYLLFFGEKALLVIKGMPPRLENIGFIYPPLPVFATMFFGADVFITQSFISSMISAYIVFEIFTKARSTIFAIVLSSFFLLSFPILYLATQRFDMYLYFFLIIFSLKLISRHLETNYSLYIFAAGPIFGLTFYTHFSSLYLIPLFLAVMVILYSANLKWLIASATVLFVPYFMFLLSFGYLNWIFTGQAFGFLRNYRLLFSNPGVEAVVSSGHIIASFKDMLKYLFMVFPVILPALWGMYRNPKLIMVEPFIIIYAFIFSNFFFPCVYASSIFLIYSLMVTEHEGLKRRWVLYTLLIVSMVSSAFLSLNSSDINERLFAKKIFGFSGGNLQEYKKAAAILSDKTGRILMDDGALYQMVYLLKQPERLILSYQYEFITALSKPSLFVDYAIALKDREKDLVFQAFEKGVKGYYVLYEDEKIIIWERLK